MRANSWFFVIIERHSLLLTLFGVGAFLFVLESLIELFRAVPFWFQPGFR